MNDASGEAKASSLEGIGVWISSFVQSPAYGYAGD